MKVLPYTGARFLILYISDTTPGPYTAGMPGLTRSWDFPWSQEFGKHIFKGRACDLENPNDVEEWNECSEDCQRAQHKWSFCVVRIVPVTAAQRVSYFSKGTTRPARVPEPPPVTDPEAPMISAAARRLALQHHIDVRLLKPSGDGGIINAADVRAAIAAASAASEGAGSPQPAPGNLSVDQLNAALEVA